ncbi:MAG: helix-turn-helix transcriptional regulator [Clostridium sp.]
MQIGENLRKYRELKGLDRKTVAEIIGVSLPTLGHWETNVNQIGIDKLDELSKLYEVSISELFGEDPSDILSKSTKNILLDRVVDMLIEDGSLSGNDNFDSLDESSKRIIIAVIDKFINRKISEEKTPTK